MRRFALYMALSVLLPMQNITCMDNAEGLPLEERLGLRLTCAVMSTLSLVRGVLCLQGCEFVQTEEAPGTRLLLSAFGEDERVRLAQSIIWNGTLMRWMATPEGMALVEPMVTRLFKEGEEASKKVTLLSVGQMLEGVKQCSDEMKVVQEVLGMTEGAGYTESPERVFGAFKALVLPVDPLVALPPQHESEITEHMANHERRLRLLREGVAHWFAGTMRE